MGYQCGRFDFLERRRGLWTCACFRELRSCCWACGHLVPWRGSWCLRSDTHVVVFVGNRFQLLTRDAQTDSSYWCRLWHTPLYGTVVLAQCWIEIELLNWTLNWLARLNWIERLSIEFSSGFFNRSFTWRLENTLALNSRLLHALASRNSQFTL